MKRLRNRVEYVLGVCKSSNAKLTPSKFAISDNVSFGGHKICFSTHTNSVLIQPAPEKMEAIRNMEEPKNKSEVQSLVGFLSQMLSFVPEVKTICPHIKKQMAKYTNFQWGAEESTEFMKIKKKV